MTYDRAVGLVAVGMVVVALSAGKAAGQTAVGSGRIEPIAAQSVQQLADRAAAGNWDTFSARVFVRRQLVGSDGRPVGPRAAADDGEEFIWQRTRAGAGWKTTMTLVAGRPRTVRSRSGDVTLPDTPTVARIEDDEDGRAPRFFNGAGVQLAGPTDAALERFRAAAGRSADGPALGPEQDVLVQAMRGVGGVPPLQGHEWVQALVMSPNGRVGRMRALEQRFGRRAGLVRGLGRYVRDVTDPEHGAVIHEVLVDEQSGVLVEANIVQGGALVSHSLFEYERAATGAVVRRGVRTERAVSSGPEAARVVSEVRYRDIRLDQKGGR